ncbi:T9SS-dependent choice-of-anchor J family protein [Flavobacterium caeni]|uniref:Por secretion system C-terminal sorting domain-containing protein n=1 Tax=Flavobacterium caeni TaxID=490189 RepID=A0A1G5JTP1_9FLAO|nr:choice-of-anchor J domain-containing protein [Flavobacterium caeni]SCY91291.1 Por secretion system C-terminal sorting domain-containing protein [Flavobacterium caeni]
MKRILLSLSILISAATQAQNITYEGFDVFPGVAGPGASGQWVFTNQSAPTGAANWTQGGGTAFANTGGQSGGATSFTLVNYTSATGTGTISNWLLAPVYDLQNGDVISFWSRQGGEAPQIYADRLQMRIATSWSDFSAMPTGADGVGDFTLLATDINPNLTPDGYPLAWTNYTYTVEGLDGIVPCRIAFRYFVTDGGTTGANSNIIGVDTFSIDRPLNTEGFFAANFAVSPNPASNVLNVNAKTGASLKKIELTDMNGRIVKSLDMGNVSQTQINVSDLQSGIYLLKISSDSGVGTSKIVKN